VTLKGGGRESVTKKTLGGSTKVSCDIFWIFIEQYFPAFSYLKPRNAGILENLKYVTPWEGWGVLARVTKWHMSDGVLK